LNSSRKANIDESVGSSTFKQCYQTSGIWAFSSLQFRWNFICLHVFRKKLHDDIFCKWPSPELNKQSWCWKHFSLS